MAGASITPVAMMHFPLFQIFPLFPKILQTPRQIVSVWPFPKIFFRFSHLPKSLMTFYFTISSLFPPYFGKTIIFPLLLKFHPDFVNVHVFLHTLRVFRFPLVWPWCFYASHNARTGTPLITRTCYRLVITRFILIQILLEPCIPKVNSL